MYICKIKKRLNPIFTVFDQHYRAAQSDQLLCFDENEFTDDASKLVANRLVKAASDSDVRSKMNVEEEMIAEIEDRDVSLLRKERFIKDSKLKLAIRESLLETHKNYASASDEYRIVQYYTNLLRQKIMLAEQGVNI